jgi:DNA mismatch repair ATPase MutS
VLADKIITNDIEMTDEAGFYMITGANNGGKTTFARAVALCQVMAQTGLYVPAEAAEMSVCDNIFTHFPRDEKLGIDTSRFTTEIKDLKSIVCNMTKYSMVILNESLQSTTPEECLKIAEIHMEIIAAAGVRGVYVTHLTGLYGKLKEINSKGYPTKISSIVSVADRESGKRLYKMKLMLPSQESLAFTIYKQFGATLEDLQKECE